MNPSGNSGEPRPEPLTPAYPRSRRPQLAAHPALNRLASAGDHDAWDRPVGEVIALINHLVLLRHLWLLGLVIRFYSGEGKGGQRPVGGAGGGSGLAREVLATKPHRAAPALK
jgi:hypothetical protein